MTNSYFDKQILTYPLGYQVGGDFRLLGIVTESQIIGQNIPNAQVMVEAMDKDEISQVCVKSEGKRGEAGSHVGGYQYVSEEYMWRSQERGEW